MRLQAEGRPDPSDRRVGKSGVPGHGANRPMGCVGRLGIERALDHSRHLVVFDRTRAPRTRLVQKALDAVLQEPATPFADRVLMNPKLSRNSLARQTLRATQDYPATLRHRAGNPVPANLALQIAPLLLAQNQCRYRPTSGSRHASASREIG